MYARTHFFRWRGIFNYYLRGHQCYPNQPWRLYMAAKPDGEVKAMEAAFEALSSLKPEEKKRVLL